MSNFAYSQDLPEELSSHLCLSMERKLMHLDNGLKCRPFLCHQMLIKLRHLDKVLNTHFIFLF